LRMNNNLDIMIPDLGIGGENIYLKSSYIL